MRTRTILTILFLAAVVPAAAETKPLQQLQQEFVDLRFGMFIHFNMSTYMELEWAEPDASPKLFNPTRLDCDQWARAAKSANMTYGILTPKHHDGFCLWKTATTDHSVKNSSYGGDVVKEFTEAFRRHGLKPIFYFSTLDMHHDIRRHWLDRGDVELIKAQLTELLTSYGEIGGIFFDGWDAGWSRLNYHDIPYREIYDHIKSLQPNCLVSDLNARKYPDSVLFYSDIGHYEQRAGENIRLTNTLPSQSSPTLQSAWFWKKSFPTEELKSVDQIVNEWLIPFNEAHCNLALNVAINREGRIDQNALDRLAEIGRAWKHPGPAAKLPPQQPQITTANLAMMKKVRFSSYYDSLGPDLINDDNFHSFWVLGKGKPDGWIEILLDRRESFNTAVIGEPRSRDFYGTSSRLKSYKIQYWDSARWADAATGTNPAEVQVLQFPTVTTSRVRLYVEASEDMPAITEFGIYNEPGALPRR